MSEETQQPDPSTEVRPPPKFKVDDMVELLDPPGTGSAMGQVIDPEGIDVDIFFSTNSYFHVGEIYRGMEEKDLRSVTPEQVATFEKISSTYEELTERAAAAGVQPALRTTDIDERLSKEIRTLLESDCSAEGFARAAAMAKAAHEFITALQPSPPPMIGIGFPGLAHSRDALERLAKVIGLGDPDAV